jgi:hypothetical protein
MNSPISSERISQKLVGALNMFIRSIIQKQQIVMIAAEKEDEEGENNAVDDETEDHPIGLNSFVPTLVLLHSSFIHTLISFDIEQNKGPYYHVDDH